MTVILLILILAVAYWYIVFGSADAKTIRGLKHGKTPDEKKVIDYFLRHGLARKLAGVMSDSDYITMVQTRANSLNLRQKAIEQTGLDEDEISEIKPINLVGYEFGKQSWARRTDDDSQTVSSRYELTWILFSESQMHMYKYSFDMDENWHNTETEEFFYQDVTSVSTATSSESARFVEKGGAREETVDTTQFRVIVPGDKMYFAMNGTDLSTANESVKAMKQMLREKKNA